MYGPFASFATVYRTVCLSLRSILPSESLMVPQQSFSNVPFSPALTTGSFKKTKRRSNTTMPAATMPAIIQRRIFVHPSTAGSATLRPDAAHVHASSSDVTSPLSVDAKAEPSLQCVFSEAGSREVPRIGRKWPSHPLVTGAAPGITLLAGHMRTQCIMDQQVTGATHDEVVHYPLFIPVNRWDLRLGVVVDAIEGALTPSRSMASDGETISKHVA